MPDPIDALDSLIDEMGLRGNEEPTPPRARRRYRSLCDPQWKLISASLRENPEGTLSIYLKLPATKLWEIIVGVAYYTQALPSQDGTQKHLVALLDFFRHEHKSSMAPSIFLCVPVEEIKKDIAFLQPIADTSRNTSVEDFIAAVEAGLRNDKAVDWITRCGGPAYIVSDNVNSTPQVGDEEVLGLPK